MVMTVVMPGVAMVMAIVVVMIVVVEQTQGTTP
jgi:hypothetical protein